MKQSARLSIFAVNYDPIKFANMCDALFHHVYTKTYSDSGLYLFYSADKSDMFIDDHTDESPWFCCGHNVIVIHGYDEDYIVNAILKFDKLKAFL